MKKTVWYRKSGKEGDVVISTRIRLARNLLRFPFPDFASSEQKETILDMVSKSLASSDLKSVNLGKLEKRELLSMVECHRISPEFVEYTENRGLFTNEDETVSIMVNEEDHIRIQVMRSGLDLKDAYKEADKLDDLLESQLEYAFDKRLGYLPQCPTNLGTAMRASLMMHLPALQETGKIHLLSGTVSKLGLVIRGLYGEGSRAEGAVYQLSNQVTLGISEKEAIENLEGIASQIIREERNARKELCQNPVYEDRVWRSMGVLKTARLLSHEECSNLLSNLRIGVALGLLPDISMDTLCGLMCDIQPATIMTLCGKDLEANERDVKRAELVRERL
ncbi:MAG: protein arginine kinase [Clostridia bacterium]|nr:protein arginine kinase [Clostridia bacterium]